ncbi:MAG: transcriptional regulatory protein-like protein [Phycisphaerales bacterium]|nr:transcriptional regulatory protein-like protein [Phycisphaerales bacterium]
MKATLMLLAAVLLISGCATQRTVTITTQPPDALIKVNNVERGTSPVIEKFVFQQPTDVFYVTALRKGFQDQTVTVTREGVSDSLKVTLKPYVRKISMIIQPVPAIISIDGRPLTPEPVSVFSADVPFSVDPKDNWVDHTLTAERTGYIKDEQVVKWSDTTSLYTLKLDLMRKDVKITTDPAGAKAYIDNEEVGTTPLTIRQRPFEYDTSAGAGTGAWVDHTIKVAKPGYDPIETKLSWDDGKTDYPITLVPKHKRVKLTTDPAGAEVKIDGTPVRQDANGVAMADLIYTPINDKGELRTYKAHITKKTADAEYYPVDLTLAWEEGKVDYPIKLREILSQPTAATELAIVRESEDWAVRAKAVSTISMKFVTDPAGDQPQKVADAPKGQTIGSLSISPDGQFLVYSLISTTQSGPKSVMYRVRADGTGGSTALSDGRSLDATPSYTAAGDKIVFSSNRAGKRLSIWAINSDGLGGVTRYTTGESNDLWPVVDASAKPRLFYQAHIDTRPDPRLYVVRVDSSLQTDLTTLGGLEPKVSPRNDAVVYTLPNDKTGKRDIYRVSDRGGAPENLTSDDDNINPSFDSNGGRIAFASDRGKEAEDGRNNFDIWIMDVANSGQPKQITRNGSVDDLPVFDPTGDAVYFRSNRGGSWGIWRISVK